ncbi:MAG: aldo/keto reductase [Bdellovibrionales bacterium]|nr:aldo/keto reductase [Bdellovibrionales bacterium]
MLYWTAQNGTKVPKLGFGTWLIKGPKCVKAVRTALDIGYRHIDTAQIYRNESEVGEAIQQSNVAREKIFLVTKVWRDSLSAKAVIHSTEESLKKLKTHYVDLLLIHWPNAIFPLEETLSAMQKLIEQNKTKQIGVSNFPVELIEISKKQAPEVICNQVEYHPFLDQRPVLKAVNKHNIFLTAYSPLARNKVFKNKVLQKMGEKYSKTAGQVVLRWLVEQKNVVAIPKAAKQKHAESNFHIFDFQLSESDRLILGNMHFSQNHRLVDPEWAPEWD